MRQDELNFVESILQSEIEAVSRIRKGWIVTSCNIQQKCLSLPLSNLKFVPLHSSVVTKDAHTKSIQEHAILGIDT